MKQRKRPYVICHMVPSIDGRIVTDRWDMPRTIHSEYERTARTFDADAWMLGRISTEPYAGKAPLQTSKASSPIPRTDFVAQTRAPGFAIALDPLGKLAWTSASIDGAHVISVLS